MNTNPFEGIDYQRQPEKYNYELYKLQKENLRLSNKQLKRYFIYSVASFLAGILSAITVQYISRINEVDTKKLEQRIEALEQNSSQLKDSFQILKANRTNEVDEVDSAGKK